MEKFDDLIRQQEEYHAILKRNIVNFKKTPKARMTSSYIETRLENLIEMWSEIKSTHKKIVSVATPENKLSSKYFNPELFDIIEEDYSLYKAELKDCLKRLEPSTCITTASPSAAPSASSKCTHSGTVPKLPEIKLPTFSGSYSEWPTFKDLFISIVHNNQNLDNVRKLHYLKVNLTGEAEQLLRHIVITNENYEVCWNLMLTRYDNKKFLSNSILKRLFSLNSLTTQNANGIKTLLDTTKDCLNALSNLGIPTASWDVIIIYLISLKLDSETKKQWELKINENSDELPTFEQFETFLTNQFRALEFLEPVSNRHKSVKIVNPRIHHVSSAPSEPSKTTSAMCLFCSEHHKLFQCPKFNQADYNTRIEFVKNNRLCFNCYGSNHRVKSCFLRTSCKICNRKHHTKIHPPNPTSSVTPPVPVNHVIESPVSDGAVSLQEVQPTVLTNCLSSRSSHVQVLLATALVKVKAFNGTYQLLRTLIDQGSQASFIKESAAQLLGLKRIPINMSISGLGGNSGNLTSKSLINLEISSIHNPDYTIQVGAYVLSKLTTLLPVQRVHFTSWPEIDHLELADPNYHTPGNVDILLGSDVYGQILMEGLLRSPGGTAIAQKSNLGWILSGQVTLPTMQSHNAIVSLFTQANDDEILKKFWELEAEPVFNLRKLTPEEQKCEELFSTTTKRDSEGRYIVKLPFKENASFQEEESREIAMKRFYSQEKRLLRNPNLKHQYDSVVEEYLQLDHMEELDPSDHKGVYLPHHAVIRNDKSTSKVRVVFDATSVSLNDNLMVGPRLQPDLRHLVMKFRMGLVCLVADIVKMYRMVKVAKEDTNYQSIVWRKNPEDELREFRLLRVTFGTSSAPYLAVKALQQLAKDEGHNFSLAANRVMEDFYMDDLMTTCESEEEAIHIYKELTAMLKKGGFQLQKWSSNNPSVHQKLEETEESKESMQLITDQTIKVLGLTWNKSSDTFVYSVHLTDQEFPITKRRVVADIARLFDPLGWIAPCVIRAKILIQKLWMSGIAWDHELPQALIKEWIEYRRDLLNLSGFEIPRWIGKKLNKSCLEIHGFSDASNSAYAAVVYTRVIDENSIVHVNLFVSKTKVAPIKQVSIPRLELCGATLLAKLLKEVAEVLGVESTNIHAWTDSTIVLAWLQGHPNRWKTFVANRVSEILTTLEGNQWSHVKSDDNPADIASRGTSPSELINNQLWINGPGWLNQSVIHYSRPDVVTSLEEKSLKSHLIVDNDVEFWSRFSRLRKMIRVIAYCRRFLYLKQKEEDRPKLTSILTSDELRQALIACIRQFQNQEFAEDLQHLKKHNCVHKKSKLYSLTPFIDEDNLLRVRGRLDNSPFGNDIKHPIIVSNKGHLAKFLILDAHEKTMHGGPQLMITYLRSKYWIIGIKNLAKEVYRKCVICARYRTTKQSQLMGQLPAARATMNRPFSISGVDYAGPIQIRTTKGRGHHSYKGYICVFVCMATRAVHLEVASDLTSQGFLAAFRRFEGRRGHCYQLWSDNGTNFRKASKDLKDLWNAERSTVLPEIQECLADNGTSWRFIPVQSPNFGGVWESGVRSTKHHLRRVLGTSTLTYEEMSTLLIQIEACLNSRPIARNPIIDDPNAPAPLTPGHFLVGEPLVVPPDHNFESSKITSLKRWQLTQRMVQGFWRRWSTEYLAQLSQRYKWANISPEPAVGDVVLVKEDNLPPAKWLYGRVEQKHPGPDNITRVVTLRCNNNSIKRPISKILILPISD